MLITVNNFNNWFFFKFKLNQLLFKFSLASAGLVHCSWKPQDPYLHCIGELSEFQFTPAAPELMIFPRIDRSNCVSCARNASSLHESEPLHAHIKCQSWAIPTPRDLHAFCWRVISMPRFVAARTTSVKKVWRSTCSHFFSQLTLVCIYSGCVDSQSGRTK